MDCGDCHMQFGGNGLGKTGLSGCIKRSMTDVIQVSLLFYLPVDYGLLESRLIQVSHMLRLVPKQR